MLSRKENQLFFDKISMKELAEKYGTPSFVYSEERIVENFHVFHSHSNKLFFNAAAAATAACSAI